MTDLEFTPEALREAVENHGVRCDGGWREDENGSHVCAGEVGFYAIVAEPLERVLDGYVSGPLLVDDPDQYVIATADAALIVPRADMGWLYKVWDNCADCYGWMTDGGRETATDFTADGLMEAAESAVSCQWNHHNLGLSTCVYTGDGGGPTGVNVFEDPSAELLDELHGTTYTTIVADGAALQFDKDQAYRFVTVPMMRACQLSGPCFVKVGDGEVWEFDPATPEDVTVFFEARSSALE